MRYDPEKQKANANRATLAVARELVAHLVAVDRRQKEFLTVEDRTEPPRSRAASDLRRYETANGSLVLSEIGTTAERPTHVAKNQREITHALLPSASEEPLPSVVWCEIRGTGCTPAQK
jgi:hypothetical protein